MDSKTFFTLVLATYITLISLEAATGRSHGLKYNYHHYHLHNNNHNRNHPNPTSTSLDNSGENQERNTVSHKHHHAKSAPWRPSSSSMDDYEDDDGDDGRHAYLMTKDTKNKKSSSSSEGVSEDQTLTSAFEKHMKGSINVHDVYAYQLPSDLWFIVRYSKNEDGQVEKYMNVVDSFTNYLEKLDSEVRTVSVNVKGVETVFRLTPKAPKRKPDNN